MLVDLEALTGSEPSTLQARDPFELAVEAGHRGDPYALEELYAIWRGARDDASIAYRRWSRARTRDGYAVYRAAADRADTAQDVLAGCLRTAA